MRGIYAADIETTGLLEDLILQGVGARLHNFGAKGLDGSEILFTQGWNLLRERECQDIRPISDLQDWLNEGHILIMHNGLCYDGEALSFFGYDISKVQIIDTLYMAWYLEPLRNRYGLAEYGEQFGVPKPVIDDWKNLSQEEYNRRVMQDCRIQLRLWKYLMGMLEKLYDNNHDDIDRIIAHLMCKGRHLRAAQRSKWKLDVEGAEKLKLVLEADKEVRFKELVDVLPRMPVYKAQKRPAKPFKMSGELSVHGIKWLKFCLLYGQDFDTYGEYEYQSGDEPGNPNSPQQVKDWLFSLGWEPETFEYKKDEDGNERKIPQINIKNSGGELDPGVERLIEENDEVRYLKGLGIVKHRLGIVTNWLATHVDGYLIARAAGFTNTLRLRHAEIVNVPSARVPWGKELRSLLIAPDGYQLLGSDLSSLEDRCKHHYQLPFDPEYVQSQLSEDFDPHLEICRLGGFLTEAQIADHKAGVQKYDSERGLGKRTNYGCQYGARPARLARDAKIPMETAQRLFDAYWKLNWSIEAVAESTETKSCNGVMWQLNPVNGFWYYLKTKKDRFSTLCQGTGAYAFDVWVEQIFVICQEKWGRDPMLLGQFHDEIILLLKDGEKWQGIWHGIVSEAIDRANKIIGMRRDIGCEIQFDHKYAGIH